jgi:hypothetical protein
VHRETELPILALSLVREPLSERAWQVQIKALAVPADADDSLDVQRAGTVLEGDQVAVWSSVTLGDATTSRVASPCSVAGSAPDSRTSGREGTASTTGWSPPTAIR